jgi:hypothetical protein
MMDVIISLVIGLFCGAWVYDDAKKRKSNHKELAGFLAFLFGVPAVVIWLIVRPKEEKNATKRKRK